MQDLLSLKTLFLAAGVWNIATGILYLGLRSTIAKRFGVGSGSDPTDRLLCNLVHLYFGVAGLWIAQDPARDMHLIALWSATKLTSVVLAIRRYYSAQPASRAVVPLLPGAADLAWATAFMASLVHLTSSSSAV